MTRTTSDYVFSPFVNSLRSQFVLRDLFVQDVGWIRKKKLPPIPGVDNEVTAWKELRKMVIRLYRYTFKEG